MNAAEYEAMYRVEDSLWWYTGMRRIGEAVLDGRLRRGAADMRILDAGCGTGGNLRWLARFGSVWGVDLSPEAMRFCRQRGLATVSRGSVTALPFPDASFDLATSFDVIYHLDVADDVAALRELHRVLRPGGAALIRVPALEQLRSEHDTAVHTRQRYSLSELEAKVKRAGFVMERASYVNTLLFPLAAVQRTLSRTGRDETPTDAHRSDVHPVAAPLNALFRTVLEAEAALLRHRDMPIGLSALVVARRPESEGS